MKKQILKPPSQTSRRTKNSTYHICEKIVLYNISTMSFGGVETFWVQKIKQEKLTKFKKLLNYNQSSSVN